MSNEQIAAIILAAGSSSRMRGVKKEYQKLSSGITVLESSVRTFASFTFINTIVIVIRENAENETRNALSAELFSARETSRQETSKPEIIFVNGGQTRRASVFNALSALVSYNPRYVLIHDGARPHASHSLVENIIAEVKKNGAVIPGLPLTDTPKELSGGFIKRHLKRADIGIAQTPQAFLFPEIFHAHEKAALVNDEEFTDDAEIWGRFCGRVAVIPGESVNRKITFMEDLY